MTKKIRKIKKLFLIILVAGEAMLLSVPYAWAIHIPSASEIAGDLEDRYHIDTGSVQNMGENLNVSAGKSPAPQVMLFFSPSDPKVGEKLTATAFPMYFSNPKEKLYYTWYLKHELSNGQKSCDPTKVVDSNHDGRIDQADIDADCCEVPVGGGIKRKMVHGNINWNIKSDGPNDDSDCSTAQRDYIIEAMRIIANNGFDTSKANYNTSGNDHDAYFAPHGGDDKGVDTGNPNTGQRMPAHCYLRDFEEGKDYELVNDGKGSTYAPECLKPDPLNPLEYITDPDKKAVCVRNASSSDTPPTPEACIYKKDATCNSDHNVYCGESSGYTLACIDNSLVLNNDDPIPNASTTDSCVNLGITNPVTKCAETTDADIQNSFCPHIFSKLGMGGEDILTGDGKFPKEEEKLWGTDPQDPDTADNGNMDEANAVGLGQYTFTWTYQEGDQVGVAVEGTSMLSTKYNDSSMQIMWAFPNNDCSPAHGNCSGGGTTSDGSDEDGVNYTACKDTKNITSKGYSFDIPTTKTSRGYLIYHCLPLNYVDPREGGQAAKLDVNLTYSPENPINDSSSGKNGDVLTAQASITNGGKDSKQLYYDWTVKANDKFTLNDWEWNANDITQSLIDDGLITGPTKGNGIDKLDIKLDMGSKYAKYFSGGTGYLRIYVKVSEFFEKKTTSDGKSDVIVKIMDNSNRILVYKVNADSSSDPNIPPTLRQNGQTCNGPFGRVRCMVVKNTVVGLRVPPYSQTGCGKNRNNPCYYDNYSWTLNGEPLICKLSMNSNCSDNKQTRYNFFPVTAGPGETYTVEVTANNVNTDVLNAKMEKNVHFTRVFEVVDPYVKIVTANENITWPRFLGDYVDLAGAYTSQFSDSVFETFPGNQVKFNAEFHPPSIQSDTTYEWILDGQNMGGTSTTLNFTAGSDIGSVNNVTLNAMYTIPQGIRQALKAYWNVTQFDSVEQNMSHSVQVEVMENETLTLKNNAKNFLAFLSSHIPGQLLFMFRILLTIVVILVTTGIVFSFMPEIKTARYE